MFRDSVKTVEHLSIIVKDLQKALDFYRNCLGFGVDCIKDVAVFKVRMALLSMGNITLDLMEPYGDSPFRAYLREKGENLHHFCVEVSNLTLVLAELQAQGVSVMFQEPVKVGDGVLVGFIDDPRSGTLIELKEKLPV